MGFCWVADDQKDDGAESDDADNAQRPVRLRLDPILNRQVPVGRVFSPGALSRRLSENGASRFGLVEEAR